MNIARMFPVFSVTFAVLYALGVQFNLALFTYFPALNKFVLGAPPGSRDAGPAMYWYGWLTTSAIGGIIACILVSFLPRDWGSKVWPVLSWAVPLAAMLYVTWLARDWFI